MCFLIVIGLWIAAICQAQAQCSIQNFQVTRDSSSPSSELTVSWECDSMRRSEFQITYQLTNRDQCDRGDGTLQPPFDVKTTGWSEYDNVGLGDSGGSPYAYATSLTYLLPYSTYFVSIQSRRFDDHSSKHFQSVTTGEAVPSGLPAASFNAFTTTYIDYSWSWLQCGKRHGNITGYEYQIYYSYSQLPVIEALFIPMTFGRKPGVRVTGLSCGTQYTFYVAAKSSEGVGPDGTVTGFTSKDPPGIVQYIRVALTATQFIVSWTEPVDRGCPVVDTYEVTCEGNTRHQDGCQDLLSQLTVMDTTMSLSYGCDMRPFYSYDVTVKATGGAVTEVSGALTPALAPSGSPGNIRITNSSDTTRVITWDEIPCSDRNGEILGYRYELALLSSSGNIVMHLDEISTTTVTIVLNAAGIYNFSVAGITVAGIGPYTYVTIDISGKETGTTTTGTVPAYHKSTASTSFIAHPNTKTGGETSKGTEVMPITLTGTTSGNTPKADSSGQNSGNRPVILAFAVSLPVCLIAIVILVILLYRSKKDTSNSANNTTTTSQPGNVMNNAFSQDDNDEGYEIPPPGLHGVSSSDYEVTLPARPQSEHHYEDPKQKSGQHYEDLNQTSVEKDHQYQSLCDKKDTRK